MAFRCPITKQIMVDPVVASNGQTYEREAIEKCIAESDRADRNASPTKDPDPVGCLLDTTLIPNRAVQQANINFLTENPTMFHPSHKGKESPTSPDGVYLPEEWKTRLANAIEANDLHSIISKKLTEGLLESDKRLLISPLRDGLSAFHLALRSAKKDKMEVCEWILNELISTPGLVDQVQDVPSSLPNDYGFELLREEVMAPSQNESAEQRFAKPDALVKLGVDVRSHMKDDENNNTLLHVAVDRGLVDVCQWLVTERGVSPFYPVNRQGRSPLVEAMLAVDLPETRRIEILSVFLGKELAQLPLLHLVFRLKAESKLNGFSIFDAILDSYGKKLHSMLEERDEAGRTVLETLVRTTTDVDSIRWLLFHGANCNLRDPSNGNPLLHIALRRYIQAASTDDIEQERAMINILQDLLRNGANQNAHDMEGRTMADIVDLELPKKAEAKREVLVSALEVASAQRENDPHFGVRTSMETQQTKLDQLDILLGQIEAKLFESNGRNQENAAVAEKTGLGIQDLVKSLGKDFICEKRWALCTGKEQLSIGDLVRVRDPPVSTDVEWRPTDIGQKAKIRKVVMDPVPLPVRLQFKDHHKTSCRVEDLEVRLDKSSKQKEVVQEAEAKTSADEKNNGKRNWKRCCDRSKLRVGQVVRVMRKPGSGLMYHHPRKFGKTATITDTTAGILSNRLKLRFQHDGKICEDVYDPDDILIQKKPERGEKSTDSESSISLSSTDEDEYEVTWVPCTDGRDLRVGQKVRVVKPPRSGSTYRDTSGLGKEAKIEKIICVEKNPHNLPIFLKFANGDTISYDAEDLDLKQKKKKNGEMAGEALGGDTSASESLTHEHSGSKADAKKKKEKKATKEESSDSGTDTQWTPYNSDCEFRPGQSVRVVKKQRSGVDYKDKSGLGKVATVVKILELPPMVGLLAKAQGRVPVVLRFADGKITDYAAGDLDLQKKDKHRKKRRSGASSSDDAKKKNKRKKEKAKEASSSGGDDNDRWTPYKRGNELRVGQRVRVVKPQRSAYEYGDTSGLGKTGIIHELPTLPSGLAALLPTKPVRIRFSDGEVIDYDAEDIDVRSTKGETSKKRKSSKSSSESSSTDSEEDTQWTPYNSDCELRPGQSVRVVKKQRSDAEYKDKSGLGKVATVVKMKELSPMIELLAKAQGRVPVVLRFADGKITDYAAKDLDLQKKDKHRKRKMKKSGSSDDTKKEKVKKETAKEASSRDTDADDDDDRWTPYKRGSELRVGQRVRVVKPQRSDYEYDDTSGLGKTGIIHELPELPALFAALSSSKPVRIRFSDGEVIDYDAEDIDVQRTKGEASKKKRKSSKSSSESISTDSEEKDTQWTPYNSDCELRPGQTVRVVKNQRSNAEYKDKSGLGKVATVMKMLELPPMIELLAKAQGKAHKPVVLRFADGKTTDYEAVDLDLRKKDKHTKWKTKKSGSSDDTKKEKAKKEKAKEASSGSGSDEDDSKDWTPYTSDCELRPGQTVRMVKTPRTGAEYHDSSGLGQIATVIEVAQLPPMMELLIAAQRGGKTPKPVKMRFADGKVVDYDAGDVDVRRKDKKKAKKNSKTSGSSSDEDDDSEWIPYTPECQDLRPGQTVRVVKTPRGRFMYLDTCGLGKVGTVLELPSEVSPPKKPVKIRFLDGNVCTYDAVDLDIKKTKDMKKERKSEKKDKKETSKGSTDDEEDVEWVPYTRGTELPQGQTVRVSNPPRTGISYRDRSGFGKVGQVVKVPEIPPMMGLIHQALSGSGQTDRKPVEIRFSDGRSVCYDAMDLDIKKSKFENGKKTPEKKAKRPTSSSGADKVDNGGSSEWSPCTDARELRVGQTVRVVNPPRSGSNYRDKSGLGQEATIVEIPTQVDRADPHDLSIVLRFANGKTIEYDADDLDIKAEAQRPDSDDAETEKEEPTTESDGPEDAEDEWVPYTPDHELRIGQAVRVVNPQRSDFTYPDCSGLGHVATILELPVVPPVIALLSRKTHKPVKLRFADGRVLVYDGADLDVKRNDHQ